MQDRSQEGLGYLAVALVPATIAVATQNPWVKFFAALGAIWTIAKAGECFQDTAKHASHQLKQAPKYQRLQQTY
jgi:hypothetical protein